MTPGEDVQKESCERESQIQCSHDRCHEDEYSKFHISHRSLEPLHVMVSVNGNHGSR